jgi:hypothetical protein
MKWNIKYRCLKLIIAPYNRYCYIKLTQVQGWNFGYSEDVIYLFKMHLRWIIKCEKLQIKKLTCYVRIK